MKRNHNNQHIPNVLLGIDPGVHSGIAIYDNSWTLKTVDFWSAIDIIKTLDGLHHNKLFVVIEAGWLNKCVFSRPVSSRAILRIATNVGVNHAHGKLIVDYCNKKKIKTQLVQPRQSKVSADILFRLIGATSRSQHARDAAMLIIPYVNPINADKHN